MNRRLAAFGVLAAAQMMLFVSVAGAVRPGYDSGRNWISQLSLGPGGGLAAANLGTCGLWLVLAAVGLLPPLRRWVAGLVLACGLCLASLSVVRTDAGIGYPPDSPTTHTTHGLIHQVIALVMGFAGVAAAPALGDVLPTRHGRRIGWAVAAVMAVSFTAGTVLVLLDAADVLPRNPSGVFERVAMYAGLGWIAVVSGWAAWGSSGPGRGAGSPTGRAGRGRTSGAGRGGARAGPGS
jgi:hypothetical protein